ncbi:hypothetical protein DXG03_002963 [Asterophora parasitica]|uniref:Uncharacterized protein n=1 Tax=Asterophora parasitica TaxID=117018 RepID=A0A9P7G3H5_9AGAR|nr:hypothetical protein DXG03_002963 [Asterophora parasitica]
MKVTGTGTRHSPIAIDDSEDEVVQELVPDTSLDSHAFQHSLADQRENLSRKRTVSSEMHEGNLQNADSDGKRPQKRKRPTNDNVQDGPVAGPSQQRVPLPNDPAVLSKKAKKRRRKLEREQQFMEAAASPNHQAWVESNRYMAHNLAPSMLPPWPPMGGGFPRLYPFPGVPGPFPSYEYPEPQFAAANSSTSSSSWVASMAMAAEDLDTDGHGAWKWTDRLERVPPRPDPNTHALLAPPHPLHNPSEPAVLPPRIPLSIPAHTSTSSHAPVSNATVAGSIGMKPEQDASSKHGLFKILPTTSSTGGGAAYIPNPARTLVMEQLPKSYRNTDWVNAWSKSACGAYPVRSSIDPSAAKALVEFATAELARKAWGSPRLGASLVGLKTHQLKGRPREDLIKAWWYRVDGVGANAGVGEIEEGEIEGDAGEKEVEVLAKKETKKERKARLAKERQEKQAALQASKPAAPPVVVQALASPISSHGISGMQSAPAATPVALSSTFHPHIPPHAGHSYSSAISPTSNPVPPPIVPLQQPPQRTLLQPQSPLDTQWRPKHELPKKPIGIPDTPTARLDTHRHIGIAPSIDSPIPPSPLQGLSPRFVGPPSTLATKVTLPHHEDMDVDDDMELESPQTGKRAHFELPAPIVESTMSTESTPAVIFAPTPTVQPTISTTSSKIAGNGSTFEHDSLASPTAIDSQFAVDSPASIDSPVLSDTPPPLEPRAMKNAPKGPSFAKRSLMARHKELEDRIARSKLELGIVGPPADSPVSTSAPSTLMAAPPVSATGGSDKQAMEDHLRSLVLRSQRNRGRTPASAPPSAISTNAIPMSSESTLPTPSSSTAVLPDDLPSAVSTFSLDDLAVSFITETIETIKATPAPPPPVPTPSVVSVPSRTNSVPAMTSVNTKLALAEKQKRLEAQIAESKFLMEKLARAKTKQERESLLAVMRERSRCVSAFLPPPPSFRVVWTLRRGGGTSSSSVTTQQLSTGFLVGLCRFCQQDDRARQC